MLSDTWSENLSVSETKTKVFVDKSLQPVYQMQDEEIHSRCWQFYFLMVIISPEATLISNKEDFLLKVFTEKKKVKEEYHDCKKLSNRNIS